MSELETRPEARQEEFKARIASTKDWTELYNVIREIGPIQSGEYEEITYLPDDQINQINTYRKNGNRLALLGVTRQLELQDKVKELYQLEATTEPEPEEDMTVVLPPPKPRVIDTEATVRLSPEDRINSATDIAQLKENVAGFRTIITSIGPRTGKEVSDLIDRVVAGEISITGVTNTYKIRNKLIKLMTESGLEYQP